MSTTTDATTFPPLAISAYWKEINDDLVRIADLVPSGQMGFSPRPELWNFQGILIHASDARDRWMSDREGGVGDGEGYPNIWATARTREDLKRELVRTFERVQRFLRNQSQLDATYRETWEGQTRTYDGHWIAFHLLEHDVHHRTELMQRLALLGVEHGIDL
jgi:uncharacterized damage-inducible protein DinB